MAVLQKVGKEEVQGSGSAQTRFQGMEEQVVVKHLNLILCDLEDPLVIAQDRPGWQWFPAPLT